MAPDLFRAGWRRRLPAVQCNRERWRRPNPVHSRQGERCGWISIMRTVLSQLIEQQRELQRGLYQAAGEVIEVVDRPG